MRFSKILAAASAVSSVAGAGLCQTYAKALVGGTSPKDQYTLLVLLVKTVVIGPFTGPKTPNPTLPGNMSPVPGILQPGMWMGHKVDLATYFDGSMAVTNMGGKPMKVNWLDGAAGKYGKMLATDPTFSGKPGSNTETLLEHLYSYFGLLLGCDVGMPGFPAYKGVPSMYSVHEFMKLDEYEFGYFVEQIGAAALSFGAKKSDVTGIATTLNDTFGMRCSPPYKGELEAICIDPKTCPTAKGAVCSKYAMASSGGGGGMMGGGGGGGGAASTMSLSKGLTGIVGFLFAAFAWL